MDTGMIVIATVLFTLILVPTLLIINNTKKQSKALFNGLTKIAKENNGTVTEHVEERNIALGIDHNTRVIYFYKKLEDEEYTQIIDLKKVISCEVITHNKRIKSDKKAYEIVDEVSIHFTRSNNEVEKLAIYNDSDSYHLNGEVTLAETFKKKVIALLSQPVNVLEKKKEQHIAMALS